MTAAPDVRNVAAITPNGSQLRGHAALASARVAYQRDPQELFFSLALDEYAKPRDCCALYTTEGAAPMG
jgi:hypothetical protein